MLTNYAQVVQFYSAPLACFADALDNFTSAAYISSSSSDPVAFMMHT